MYALLSWYVCQISAFYVDFTFISLCSCYQLLTGDDNCYEKKSNGIFIYSLHVIFVPKLSSVGCLGARLESVTDGQTHAQTDARQVNIVLTLALLSWCQGLSSAINFIREQIQTD